MTQKAPGKSFRNGLSFMEIADMFKDEETSRKWLESVRWPQGPHCPHCGSFNVQCDIKHPKMTHRCRDCDNRPMFTLRHGTVMEGSKIKHRAWAIGVYLFSANIKGVSSMQLRRELKIGQKAAWFLMHRLRTALATGEELFSGPVEADEKYCGGSRKNMSNAKRRELKEAGFGQGPARKTVVAGIKDRDSNKVVAKVVEKTDAATLQGFVEGHTEEGAQVYTDEATAYAGIDRPHETVKHSISEYVRDQAHVNGMESFWAMMERGHDGIYHKMSPKHLQKYVDEFAGRHNVRNADTIKQMESLVKGMVGKRLRYEDLIADNGLASGARS